MTVGDPKEEQREGSVLPNPSLGSKAVGDRLASSHSAQAGCQAAPHSALSTPGRPHRADAGTAGGRGRPPGARESGTRAWQRADKVRCTARAGQDRAARPVLKAAHSPA